MKKNKINNFKEHIYHETLSNGLNIYIVPLKNKSTFASMLLINYGGKDINFKVNGKKYNTPTGIAHFLEHKMFEKDPSPFDFYNKYGSDVNAQTSEDYTSYYFIGTKGFNQSLRFLLNWIKSLDITEEDVEKEKGIILEEANMYKDNPASVLNKKLKENIYFENPKKYEVIGFDKDIKSITKKDLDLCYNTFYTPNNMSLIVTGNVSAKKVIELAKEELKDFKNKSIKIERLYGKEKDKVVKKTDTIKMNITVPKVSVAYKINKDLFKSLKLSNFELDLYLEFLINIGLGETSQIRNKWLEENLFTSAYYKINNIDTHYIIEFYAISEDADKLIKQLKNYLKDIKLDEESFIREKKIWISTEIKKMDYAVPLMGFIADDIIDYNKFISNKNEIIKNLKYDTLIKIKDLMSYNNETVVKIIPKK